MSCPVPHHLISQFNPKVLPQRDDPFSYFRWARKEQPVSYMPELNAWMVTRYEDVQTVLNDPERFSSRVAVPMPSDNRPEILDILEQGLPEGKIIINQDPPEHTRHRQVANQALSSDRLRSILPRIRGAVDQLIDGFFDRRQVELIWEFADPVAYSAVSIIIGIPSAEFIRTRHWNDDMMTLSVPDTPYEDKIKAAHRFVEYQRYLRSLIEARRREPLDDAISELIRQNDRPGSPMSTDDIVTFVWGVSAGLNSTRDAIGNTLYCMLSDRSHWERATTDAGCIPALFEESLRRDAPLRGLFREATREVELGGVTLPARSRLYVLYASANRDETHFSEPDAFLPGRPDLKGHFGFGAGPHACAGQQLARAVGRVAISTLTERLPDLDLMAGFTPAFLPKYFFHGLQRLDVVW